MRRGPALALFIILGSLFNILVTGLTFIALLFVYGRTLGGLLNPATSPWALLLCFGLSLVAGTLAYRKALLLAGKRLDLDRLLGRPRAN